MCKRSYCFEEIFKLLKSIQVCINEHLKINAQNYGLNITEFMILFEIDYHQGISLNELSKTLDLPKSTVSRIVDQMVQKKFIIRIIPQENRRMVKLYVNQDYFKSQEADKIKEELDSLVERIDPDKERQIISALEELNRMLSINNINNSK